jgi:hypothetical protein
VFWLKLVLMMLVTASFLLARALPSLLDYRDRTDLPVLDSPYLCNTPACDHRIFLVVAIHTSGFDDLFTKLSNPSIAW